MFMHGYYMLALCELHNTFLPGKLGGGERRGGGGGILESDLTQQAANGSWLLVINQNVFDWVIWWERDRWAVLFYYNTIAKDNNISIPASRLDEILW